MEYNHDSEQIRALTSVYFTGSVDEVRASLLKEEDLLNQVLAKHPQSDDCSAPKRAASMRLRFVYGRLLTLETLEGNTNAATMYFEKFRSLCAGGLRDANLSSNEVAAGLKKITPEGCVQFILKTDKEVNDGKEPNYMTELNAAPFLPNATHP